MTLDADALEGHPLYLPDGITIPPAHYLNWGTLFYNRERNLAIGTRARWRDAGGQPMGRAHRPRQSNSTAHLDGDRLAGSGGHDLHVASRRTSASGGRSGIRRKSVASRARIGRCSRC